MKTDAQIQQDVTNELKWNAMLSTTDITATVTNGVVTLTGTVNTYANKPAAEKACMRISGVKSVNNEIEVRVTSTSKRTDADLTEAITNTLKWHSLIPQDKIRVRVEDGWSTIEGEVEWEYQKNAARGLVDNLIGVRGVTNLVKVVPPVSTPKEIKEKLTACYARHAGIDPTKIKVEVTGSKVTLTGTVRSLAEKKEAEYTALSAPGVTHVDNLLDVSYKNVMA